MEILKFEGGAPRGRAKSSSNKKSIRVAVAVGAVALVAVLSSTLAANITINTGSSVEFGQGLAGAAACDSSLTLTPNSVFSNGNGSTGTFYFGSIKVADASTTSGSTGLALCSGKYIRLAAYDSSTATPLTITTSPSSTSTTTSVEVLIGATNSSGLGAVTVPTGAGATISATTSSSFTVALATAASVTATAGQVYKITVESHS
jgi:hypothetical protein